MAVSPLRRPFVLRAALGALIAVGLLGGGWLWLRDSSLVSVEHVHVSGVHGVDALEIRGALDAAARRMTTMDFNAGALRSAVASFAVVSGLRVTASFPHTMSIAVSERLPVATLLSAGERTAVAADGTVLGPALLSSSLPLVSGTVAPAPGARVSEAGALADLTVLGAVPAPLVRFVARVFNGREGLTVAMRNGLLVYFGNAFRPHAKWLSLARVLAAPSSAGAWYVDVRVPERPAAGIAGASTSAPARAGASDPTAAALAASLAAAIGGGSTTSTSASEGTGSQSAEGSQPSGSEPSSSETSGSRSTEAPRTSGGSESKGSAGGEGASTPSSGAPSGSGGGHVEALGGPSGGSSAPPATGG